jgi:hypothetical protein
MDFASLDLLLSLLLSLHNKSGHFSSDDITSLLNEFIVGQEFNGFLWFELLKIRLEKQRKVIELQKAKVKKLRDEQKAIATKEEEVKTNGVKHVKTLIVNFTANKLKNADRKIKEDKIIAKRVIIKKVNDRLSIAIKNAAAKRARIGLLWARLKRLRLRLKLNKGNRWKIRTRMLRFRRRVTRIRRRWTWIRTRIQRFRLRRIRLRT